MFSFLLGPLASLLTAFPSLAGKYVDLLVAKQNTAQAADASHVAADKELGLATLQNLAAQQQLVAAQHNADRVSPWTAWMLPALFALCLYHFGAVVLDCVPAFGHVVGSWRVAVLPNAAMVSVESTTLISVVGVTLGVPALRRLFK